MANMNDRYNGVIPLIICTVTMGDWYGVANACAIVVSIAARLHILGQQRRARDCVMESPYWYRGLEKACIIKLPDGKMVTMRTTNAVLSGILRTQRVYLYHPTFYALAQQAAWIALGTHLLVLGMCTLATQIYIVVLLVSSTVAISSTTDWSADIQHKTTTPLNDWLNDGITTIPFNDDWDVIKTEPASFKKDGMRLDKCQVAWARLGLSRQQEAKMLSWQLFPEMDVNDHWWEQYRALQDDSAA
jgi:hypothetical protein